MERLIITGGNGFIGGHLVRRLLESKQYSLVLIANRSNTEREMQHSMPMRSYTADIRDKKKISDIFMDEKADGCIHLAAKISVADSIRNPDETMEINVKGTTNVLEGCYNSGVKNFIFASSAAVYGDVKVLPISENQPLKPLSPYGTSKMLAENSVVQYHKLKKIRNAILFRIFNVYGTGNTNESDVISKFAARLSKGLSPIIYKDGNYTRDFISVDDVVDAILSSIRLMEHKYNPKLNLPPIFNLGSGRAISINELARKMISISGLELDPIYQKVKDDNKVILHSYADMSKTKKVLQFVPKKNLETGLKEILEPPVIRE